MRSNGLREVESFQRRNSDEFWPKFEGVLCFIRLQNTEGQEVVVVCIVWFWDFTRVRSGVCVVFTMVGHDFK